MEKDFEFVYEGDRYVCVEERAFYNPVFSAVECVITGDSVVNIRKKAATWKEILFDEETIWDGYLMHSATKKPLLDVPGPGLCGRESDVPVLKEYYQDFHNYDWILDGCKDDAGKDKVYKSGITVVKVAGIWYWSDSCAKEDGYEMGLRLPDSIQKELDNH